MAMVLRAGSFDQNTTIEVVLGIRTSYLGDQLVALRSRDARWRHADASPPFPGGRSTIFPRLRDDLAHRAGDLLARRLGVEAAHEPAVAIHQVEVGAVVHDVVVVARTGLVRRVIDA